jgi:hypothetical protein
MSDEPENLTLRLLREMRAEIFEMRGDVVDMRSAMATKVDLAELRSELTAQMNSLRADVASDMLTSRKEVSDQVAGLRSIILRLSATARSSAISKLACGV